MKLIIILTFVLLTAVVVFGQEDKTEKIADLVFKESIEKKLQVGMVLGVINGNQSKILTYGKTGTLGNQQLNGDSVFEIASVTKPFTGILLADMVERGEVNFSDPVSFYLPASVKPLKYQEREISLLDLATQTSGLPRMPANFAPKDEGNPYVDYTVEQLYEFLAGYKLERDIGLTYEYSNLGFGLLGHALAQKVKTDYEGLVVSRVCLPLKMHDTKIKLTEEMQTRLTAGHDKNLNPARNWDSPTLAGAGALRSTANDMLKFLAANMGRTSSSLLSAMKNSHLPRHRTPLYPVSFIGLGWHIRNYGGTEIVWHNGATGGYSSFAGFNKKHNLAVVVLTNTSNGSDTTSAGMGYLLSLIANKQKSPETNNLKK